MQSFGCLANGELMGRIEQEEVTLPSSPLLLLLLYLMDRGKANGKKRRKKQRRRTPALFDTVHKERLNNAKEAGLISASGQQYR
jgi:hypothetical protein